MNHVTRLSFCRKSMLMAVAVVALAVSSLRAQERRQARPALVPDSVGIPRPSAEDLDLVRRRLNAFIENADAQTINKRIEMLANGKQIRFVNINDKLADEMGRLRPGISADGLHLEQPSYEIWAQALKPYFEEILGPPAAEDHAPPPTGDPSSGR